MSLWALFFGAWAFGAFLVGVKFGYSQGCKDGFDSGYSSANKFPAKEEATEGGSS